MKIYFGGTENLEKAKLLAEENVDKILLSFYSIKRNNISIKDTVSVFKSKTFFIIDSGAYSERTRGVYISLFDYIDFIKMYRKHFDSYVNLDKIYNAEQTWKNQKIMEKEGLEPIPVFHYNESLRYLIYYCHRYDFVGIGGIANVNINIGWLEKVFRILNKYKTKAHAFGTLNPRIITKFNWFSCDTTDWLSGIKYRRIFILDKGTPKRIRIENAFMFRSIIEYLGIDYHRLHDNVEKTRLNIRVLKEFEKELNRVRA